MPTLRIRFAELFENDTVRVTADGLEVLRLEGVTTNFSVGLAHVVTIDVPRSPVRIVVSAPARGTSAAIQIDVATFPILQVNRNRDDGQLTLTPLEREPQAF